MPHTEVLDQKGHLLHVVLAGVVYICLFCPRKIRERKYNTHTYTPPHTLLHIHTGPPKVRKLKSITYMQKASKTNIAQTKDY